MTTSDELHVRLEQKPALEGHHAEEAKKEPESQRVYRYMDKVIEVVRPSSISSHIKGDVIRLLERLRNEEVLRLVEKESKR